MSKLEDDIVDQIHDIFMSVPEGNDYLEMNPLLLAKWKEYGPINVKKLAQNQLI